MTLGTVATVAAIGLLIEAIILVLVVGVIFGFGWKGLGFLVGKADALLHAFHARLDWAERFVTRAGYAALAPLVWLYGRAAWLRTFTRSAWYGRRAVG